MSVELILFLLTLLSFIGFRHFLKNGDEIPLILVIFNLLVITRLFALISGKADWISFDYGILFEFTLEKGNIVNNLIFTGTLFLFSFYLIFYKKNVEPPTDSETLFEEFLEKNKNYILIGFGAFSLFKMFAGDALYTLLGKGYGFLLTLATSSFIILTFLIFYKLKTDPGRKLIYGVIFFMLALSTYNPGLRYQFLGWAIPIFIYLLKSSSPGRKTAFYTIGISITFIFFSIAGSLRDISNHGKSFGELVEVAVERIEVAEDVNFIDGFVMLHQVYPEYLDFHYGMDHLAIFLRPIPRSIWPGKPEGAWQQKYAQKYNFGENYVTGISPTLYGVFYGEGGGLGVIVFAIIWAILFNKIREYTEHYELNLQYILKGMFIASLLPFLRSGDLAGDISIIGMSYWPIFIFVYQYNKFLKQKRELDLEKSLRTELEENN